MSDSPEVIIQIFVDGSYLPVLKSAGCGGVILSSIAGVPRKPRLIYKELPNIMSSHGAENFAMLMGLEEAAQSEYTKAKQAGHSWSITLYSDQLEQVTFLNSTIRASRSSEIGQPVRKTGSTLLQQVAENVLAMGVKVEKHSNDTRLQRNTVWMRVADELAAKAAHLTAVRKQGFFHDPVSDTTLHGKKALQYVDKILYNNNEILRRKLDRAENQEADRTRKQSFQGNPVHRR